jgi:hypothetical protein
MRSRNRIAFAAALATLGAAFSVNAQPIPPAPTGPFQPTPAQPPPGQYPQSQTTPGQYPQSPPPSYQGQQGQPMPNQAPQGQPQGQPMPGQYPQGQPMSGQQYPAQQGPTQGRPSPSDAAVDTLDTPAPVAAAAESTSGPDLAWYKPISADVSLEDRSKERFVTGLVNGHSFVTGPIRGTGSEVLATFNFNSVWGIGLGAYLPNGNFVAGVDLFRYAGFNLPTGKRKFGLTVLVPTVEVRYVAGSNVLYLGSGLTGLRVTACPFVMDLRLPNITIWQPIAFTEASKPSLSVGATASFGLLF